LTMPTTSLGAVYTGLRAFAPGIWLSRVETTPYRKSVEVRIYRWFKRTRAIPVAGWVLAAVAEENEEGKAASAAAVRATVAVVVAEARAVATAATAATSVDERPPVNERDSGAQAPR
jgi:hypothetical protein